MLSAVIPLGYSSFRCSSIEAQAAERVSCVACSTVISFIFTIPAKPAVFSNCRMLSSLFLIAFIDVVSANSILHSEKEASSATAEGRKSGRKGTVTASYVKVAK